MCGSGSGVFRAAEGPAGEHAVGDPERGHDPAAPVWPPTALASCQQPGEKPERDAAAAWTLGRGAADTQTQGDQHTHINTDDDKQLSVCCTKAGSQWVALCCQTSVTDQESNRLTLKRQFTQKMIFVSSFTVRVSLFLLRITNKDVLKRVRNQTTVKPTDFQNSVRHFSVYAFLLND